MTFQNRKKAPIDNGGVSTTGAHGIRGLVGFGDRPLNLKKGGGGFSDNRFIQHQAEKPVGPIGIAEEENPLGKRALVLSRSRPIRPPSDDLMMIKVRVPRMFASKDDNDKLKSTFQAL